MYWVFLLFQFCNPHLWGAVVYFSDILPSKSPILHDVLWGGMLGLSVDRVGYSPFHLNIFWDAKSRSFAIVRIKIRGTYFDQCFGCWGSAAWKEVHRTQAQDFRQSEWSALYLRYLCFVIGVQTVTRWFWGILREGVVFTFIFYGKTHWFYIKAWLADMVRGKGHVRGFFKISE